MTSVKNSPGLYTSVYFWMPESSFCGSRSYIKGFDWINWLMQRVYVLFPPVTITSFPIVEVTCTGPRHLQLCSLNTLAPSPGLNIKWVDGGNLEIISSNMCSLATTVAISALESESADRRSLCLGRGLLITGGDDITPKTKSDGTSSSGPIKCFIALTASLNVTRAFQVGCTSVRTE